MKKLLMAVAIASTVFLVNCNSVNNNDPKAVLTAFLEALGKKDIDGAKKYATEDSKSSLDMIKMYASMGKDSKDAKDEHFDKTKTELSEPVITGDEATIIVKDKGAVEGETYKLRKEKGAWKVAFDKMGGMKDGLDKMKEGTNQMTDSLNNMMPAMDSINNEMNKMTDSIK